jgi:hypothetical protein
MPVNQMDPTPLYEQLAAILRAQMSDGALSSRALLPSESYLQSPARGMHGCCCEVGTGLGLTGLALRYERSPV